MDNKINEFKKLLLMVLMLFPIKIEPWSKNNSKYCNHKSNCSTYSFL